MEKIGRPPLIPVGGDTGATGAGRAGRAGLGGGGPRGFFA